MPLIKASDKFFSQNFFDKTTFDDNAWYYDKDKVREYKLKNIHTRANFNWFEEDWADRISEYLT